MMLFVMILKFLILKLCIVQSFSQGIMEDIFYGESPINKDLHIKKLQLEIIKNEVIPISNIQQYLHQNETNLKEFKRIIKTTGNCSKLLSIKNSLNNGKKYIRQNLNLLNLYLNDKNYLFNDDTGNIIAYSTCTNFLDLSCTPEIYFISKLDFSFFKYSISNEIIGYLSNTALDLISDRFKDKNVIYQFGGIDRSGKHDNNLFKYEIDNIFGQIKIHKIGTSSLMFPGGRADSSLNILNCKGNPLSKDPNQDMIIVFGGVNDIKTLNELWTFRTNTNTWSQIENEESPILPRKGHSAVLFSNNTIENINPNVLRSYNLIIFGGKNDFGYMNDLLIIDISYLVLQDKFSYKFRSVSTKGIIEPEKREGHRSLIKDNYLYIYGGCNYEFKKCYKDIYRINLNDLSIWEKVEYFNKEGFNNEVKISPENSYFTNYMGDLITFSHCNKDECINKDPAILVTSIDCKKLNQCKQHLYYSFKRLKIKNHLKNEFKALMKNKIIKTKTPKLKELMINYYSKFNNITLNCQESKIIKKEERITKNLIQLNKNSSYTNYLNGTNTNKTSIKSHLNETTVNQTLKITNRSIISNYSSYISQNNTIDEKIKEGLMKVLQNLFKGDFNDIFGKKKEIPKIQEDFSNELGFLLINDRVKNTSIPIKKEEKLDTNNNELKLINKTLNTIQQNLLKLEKSIVIKRNDDESNRRNQINSNYILMSNLENTKMISKNLNNFQNRVFQNLSNNISTSIQENFNNLSKKIDEIDKSNNAKIEELENLKITQDIVIVKDKNCTNGKYIQKSESCLCNEGFTGNNCEIVKNCSKNCSGNGECSLGKCYCNPGFKGKICSITIKCENDCNKKGKCQNGKCFCDAGFSGKDCSRKLKCPNNCNNKGICFRDKCLCSPGWGGKDCSILKIDSKPCNNNCNENGICRLEKCFCYPGFGGKYCQEKLDFNCPPFITNSTLGINTTWTPCNNNGLCKFGMCFCFPGYKGDDCSIVETCKNNCSYNGICVKGSCVCKNPFIGESCDINKTQQFINKLNGNKFRKNEKKFKDNDNEFDFYSFTQINEKKVPTNKIIIRNNSEFKHINLNKKIKSEMENKNYNSSQNKIDKNTNIFTFDSIITLCLIIISFSLFLLVSFLICMSKN